MGEHCEAQQRRADQLRAQIEELRRSARDPSRPRSPRDFTDEAAAEDHGQSDGEAPAAADNTS